MLTFNKLLDHSRGDFIAFLDSDDKFALDKIDKQIEAFKLNPKMGLIGTNNFFINHEGDVYDKSNYPSSNKDILNFISNKKFSLL